MLMTIPVTSAFGNSWWYSHDTPRSDHVMAWQSVACVNLRQWEPCLDLHSPIIAAQREIFKMQSLLKHECAINQVIQWYQVSKSNILWNVWSCLSPDPGSGVTGWSWCPLSTTGHQSISSEVITASSSGDVTMSQLGYIVLSVWNMWNILNVRFFDDNAEEHSHSAPSLCPEMGKPVPPSYWGNTSAILNTLSWPKCHLYRLQ